jgi:hypothetical protein
VYQLFKSVINRDAFSFGGISNLKFKSEFAAEESPTVWKMLPKSAG